MPKSKARRANARRPTSHGAGRKSSSYSYSYSSSYSWSSSYSCSRDAAASPATRRTSRKMLTSVQKIVLLY